MLEPIRNRIKDLYLLGRAVLLGLIPATSTSGVIPAPLRSVLVISQIRLGDIALEIPALHKLRQTLDGSTFGIVAPVRYHDLLSWGCRPDVCFDVPASFRLSTNWLATLRRHDWQVVIDLNLDYHLWSARIGGLLNAPVRIGFDYAGRGRYFSKVVARGREDHVKSLMDGAIAGLGIQRSISFYPPPITPMDFGHLDREGRGRRVGLHPGATHATQRWPVEYFAELAILIRGRGDICCVIGSRTDQDLVARVVKLAGGAATPVVCGDQTMELAAALRAMDLLVCNNSGPLHLAGVLGVPTLSFMGPTVKSRWWPRGDHSIVLRMDGLPCIGCNLGYCKIRTHACMNELKPAAAFEAYRQAIADLSLLSLEQKETVGGDAAENRKPT